MHSHKKSQEWQVIFRLVRKEQNRAIMIFAILIIIFPSLPFPTSLFGMNVREWSSQSTDPDFHHIFVIAGCVSAAIIIIALLLAFNKPIRQRVARFFHPSLMHWPIKGVWLLYQGIRLSYRKLFGPCIGEETSTTSDSKS